MRLPDGVLPLTVLLYAADPATGMPFTGQSYIHATFPTPGTITSFAKLFCD